MGQVRISVHDTMERNLFNAKVCVLANCAPILILVHKTCMPYINVICDIIRSIISETVAISGILK